MSGDNLFHSGFAAIIGVPNTGKSTFLNKVLGSKVSIVSSKPQTTRNKIRGIYNTPDSQVVFVDTPGITPTDFGKLLNNWMNRYSISAAKEADIVLFFVDVSTQHPEQGIGSDEENIISKFKKKQTVILVANKTDIVKKMRADDTLAVYKRFFPFAACYAISAMTGEGIKELMDDVSTRLPEGPKYFPDDFISDQEDEFLAAEIIREKIFEMLHQEIPYSTTVTVENMRDHNTKKMLLIDATIHVAKRSHKGMIIGEGGSMLKAVGEAARIELEVLFGQKIGLKLFVRIEEKWYEKENLLKKVGFGKDFDGK